MVALAVLATSCTGSYRPGPTGVTHPNLRECASDSLSAHAGQPFLAEQVGNEILTDTGRAPCVLAGVPSVALLSQNGSSIAVKSVDAADRTVNSVTLQPNGAAALAVYWANWCGPDLGPLKIRIYLPAGEGILSGPYQGNSKCINSSIPSTVTVIDAYSTDTARLGSECMLGQLHLTADTYGEAGGSFTQTFNLTNTSGTSCWLRGWPTLETESSLGSRKR